MGPNIKVSEEAKQTAQKLHITLQEIEDKPNDEAYIAALLEYFMLQSDKIAQGLMDEHLPNEVREVWEELLALLERRNRKLVKVERGSIILQLYCPTQAAVDDLEEVIDSVHFNEAVTNFYKTLGKKWVTMSS